MEENTKGVNIDKEKKKTIKKEEKKKKKKINKAFKKLTSEKEKTIEIRKKRYIFEAVTIIIIVIFMLILLCNRTFFRENYKTDYIDVNIPLLSFFIKDEDNEIVLKTLRKSEYLREYFSSYLSSFPRYSCGDFVFYYDNSTNTAIYDISIEKNGIIKTIKINYIHENANVICDNLL